MSAPPLKDLLFNREKVRQMATELAAADPGIDAQRFEARVVSRFPELELKQRIEWMVDCLAEALPREYRAAVATIVRALPAPCNPTLGDGDYGDFIYAPYSRFVARHGCTREDLATSLDALRQITTRFSAEDAIRPFIDAFPEQTFATLLAWCDDPHYHVRRLASEGTRPRLPWSSRLATPAEAAVPILDRLHADPTRYVTRSVANHVNDITKDAPELALALLDRWRAERRQSPDELAFIVRHATRTLVKAGDARALALHGVAVDAPVQLHELRCDAAVPLGEALTFAVTLTAPAGTDLLIDYAIGFPGTRGRMGRKVYKLTTARATHEAPLTITHRHPLRANMTTRRIIPGTHHLELQVNGRVQARTTFEVTPAD